MFFSAERDVFALLLSVLCEQSRDGIRACVKARFQTQSHEGIMRAVGHRLQQRVFVVFVIIRNIEVLRLMKGLVGFVMIFGCFGFWY